MRLYLILKRLRGGTLRPLDSRVAANEREARQRAEQHGTVERDDTLIVIAVASICELGPETSPTTRERAA